ncbi:MAG TPA: substrate-binding domain-containing protein [Candidatus Paceibacterota bacterium]|nr:substrate-binding domain-containing protein [Candidatus Paceibacterota bacterium]
MLRTRKYIVVATAAALLFAGVSSASAAPKKLLGIVSITATDSNNARVIKGATAAAKAAGWTVQVVDAQGNAATANAAIRNFASRKAGMIFDLVFPTSSLGAGLAAARAKNIPVATWGGGLGKGVVMTTGNGAPFAGPATKALLGAMGPEGHILALTYRTGQVCRDRETIFDNMLTGKAGITVTKNEVTIPGYLQDGAKYATAWLAAHPAGSGKLAIWGCWEDPTLGAISALKQQGRTDVLTYGINGSSTAIKAVQDGSLTATVYEEGVKEGAMMFATTLKAIKAGKKWKPITINVPGVLVTASNVGAFVTSHPEALK